MVKDNVLSESGSIKWKVKNNTLKFLYDTAVYVTISNATLTCYTQKDSTELYNVYRKILSRTSAVQRY
jgi:P pilus assembly chaperone PapD